jgi:hypothetical protein
MQVPTLHRQGHDKTADASVTHQIAINADTAAVRVTSGLPASRSQKIRIANPTSGPAIKPMRCFIVCSCAVVLCSLMVTGYDKMLKSDAPDHFRK